MPNWCSVGGVMKKKPQFMVLVVRQWFDKYYGNTYFTYLAAIDNSVFRSSGMMYGSSPETSFEDAVSQASGLYEFPDGINCWNANSKGVWFILDVVPVSRKKDLHNGGR